MCIRDRLGDAIRSLCFFATWYQTDVYFVPPSLTGLSKVPETESRLHCQHVVNLLRSTARAFTVTHVSFVLAPKAYLTRAFTKYYTDRFIIENYPKNGSPLFCPITRHKLYRLYISDL